MSNRFQEFRFARLEAMKITRFRLEQRLKDGIQSISELETAIDEQLKADPAKQVPWRRSEAERVACAEGIRLAALEFFWEHRNDVPAALDNSPMDELTTVGQVEDSGRHLCRRSPARHTCQVDRHNRA